MKSPESKNQEAPVPLNPEQKLALAEQDRERWKAAAANPDLSPRAAGWALDLARSAGAEVRLRQKALAWQNQQDNPILQGDDAALAQTLQLPLSSSPPSPQSPSEIPSPDSSISPATSGSKTSPT